MEGKISDYIHSADFYDAVNGDYMDDFGFYLELCKKTNGRVLELCCGTGRLTIPLFKAGVNIEGLDVSSSMLTSAKNKAKNNMLSINFHQNDMLNFDLQKKYDLIILPFNSMQCIYSTSKVEQLLDNIKKHLLPNGHFAFDVYNPSINFMVDRSRNCIETMRINGGKTIIKESCQYDSAYQINRAIWYVSEDGVESKHSIDTRCFFPLELDMLLNYNGFLLKEKFGGFDKSRFTSDSLKQICVCMINNT